MTRHFDVAAGPGGPHVPAPASVHWTMRQVLIALVPGVAAYVWFFGPAIVIQLALATAAADPDEEPPGVCPG